MRLVNKRRFAISIGIVLLITIRTININNIIASNKNKKEIVKVVEVQSEPKVNFVQNIDEENEEKSNINNIIYSVTEEIPNTYYDIPLTDELQDYIREKCEQYDVNMENILAIIKTESDFEHDVKSKNQIGGNYSVGIMQLNANYIGWFGELTELNEEFDINNIYHNIEGGIAVWKFYKNYWEKQGLSGDKLLIYSQNSYNMGIEGFKKYIKNTGSISRSYDRKVNRHKEDLIVK